MENMENMEKEKKLYKIAFVALLIAIGVVIPLFSPLKVVQGPASFTLAVHTPIFIAVFISPIAAIAVVIGTAMGFFIGNFPPVIVGRSVSHVLFALLGSLYLYFRPQILSSALKMQIFSFIIGIIHAWAEVIVVYFFYMDSGSSGIYLTTTTTFLLVGLGGLLHSMVDFVIAFVILRLLTAQKAFKPLFLASE